MYQFRLGKIGRETVSASNWIAPIALGVALLGIASASILIAIAEREIEPNAITCDRLLIAAVVFSIWNQVKTFSLLNPEGVSQSQPYTKRGIILLLIAGISFAISLSLWAWSLTQTSIANSTLLNNMMPIFTTLGGWLIFRQRFSPRFIAGMAVAIGGAVAIGIEDMQLADSNLTGDGAALVAAMFSAVSILSLEQLRVEFSTPIIMQWTSLAGGLFVLPLVFFTEGQLLPISLTGWLAVIGLGAISQALGQGLLTYSLAKFSSGFVAVSMLSIPVIAAVLAMIIFAEQLSLYNWLAFAVVLFGIYLAVSAKQTSNTNN
ncbi:DMT family transporter [Myxosarcina sp. GI1]|uniref:DMT family transporter n=1 Tax=Myxosarcina sp. GI1 TaxID=1541065 RepID=UPI000567F957|nr:DMT family transporter [Myxosarcina sp. GI1]